MPLDNDLTNSILQSIATSGIADSQIKNIINGSIGHILSLSSGSPRFQSNVIKKFKLITKQPFALTRINALSIRCALCRSVIKYPCWYHEVKYAVNHFHYFVCFDVSSVGKPTCKCYKRG